MNELTDDLPWRTLGALCVGSFAILMDTTIVNVAVPDLIDSLHAGFDQVLWINNAYLLVFGSLLIVMSRLGDNFGQRRLFVLGLAVFGGSSALCGLAPDPATLIAARAFQGLGAAMLAPQPLAIIAAIFPDHRRGAALGVYASMIGLAAVIGPTLGGVLVTYIGWRWIFYVNVPITIAGIALALRIVPDLRLGRRHRLDMIGVALVALGLAGVVFGLIEGQRYDWSAIAGSPITIPEVIIAGVALLVVFGFWERHRRTREPLLPLGLFSDKAIVLLCVLAGATQFGLISVMILGAINLQSALGYSAVVSGLTSLPLTIVLASAAPFAGRLSDRIGSRTILVAGFTVYATGLVVLVLVLSVHATPFTFIIPYMLIGLGMSGLFAPLSSEALHRVPRQLAGSLSGMLSTSRQVGAAIGSAVTGGLLAALLAGDMQAKATTVARQLPYVARQRFLHGFAHIAHSGLHVGRGESGGVIVPAGIPEPLRSQLQNLAHTVFITSYIDAMQATILVPAALMLLCAIGCALLLRRRLRPALEGLR